jgi:DNA-3-methyladenine glycosylase
MGNMSPTKHLQRPFFTRSTLKVAHDLLGQRLVLQRGDERLAGLITETEAYIGSEDLACHAHVGKTARNAVMWGRAGHAYVYFTYGMHWMLNFVAEGEGFPAAVLLRGLWPVEGILEMQHRRPVPSIEELGNGPAKLCQAFGIDRAWNGHDLCSPSSLLFIEEAEVIADSAVTSGPRVGLNNVPEPWKSKPWRFRIDPLTFR